MFVEEQNGRRWELDIERAARDLLGENLRISGNSSGSARLCVVEYEVLRAASSIQAGPMPVGVTT